MIRPDLHCVICCEPYITSSVPQFFLEFGHVHHIRCFDVVSEINGQCKYCANPLIFQQIIIKPFSEVAPQNGRTSRTDERSDSIRPGRSVHTSFGTSPFIPMQQPIPPHPIPPPPIQYIQSSFGTSEVSDMKNPQMKALKTENVMSSQTQSKQDSLRIYNVQSLFSSNLSPISSESSPISPPQKFEKNQSSHPLPVTEIKRSHANGSNTNAKSSKKTKTKTIELVEGAQCSDDDQDNDDFEDYDIDDIYDNHDDEDNYEENNELSDF